MDEIRKTVKKFILEEFLPGEDPSELTDSTPLISGGILDSIATLKLVAFLEEQYGIVIGAHETDPGNLNTIASIAAFVQSKR
jgi:acyl carrier protein